MDLAAVVANARAVRGARPGKALIAVVKRDAYGHGAVAVARSLRGVADIIAVADAEEAAVLRQAGIRAPILLLGPAAAARRGEIERLGLLPSVTAERDFAGVPGARGGYLGAHLKFDTGMGRLGLDPALADRLAGWLRRRGLRRLAGTWTHLSAADEAGFTRAQLRRFDAALAALRRGGIDPGLTHAANSAAVLASPAACAYRAVRPGLLLYGCVPGRRPAPRWLRPAMSFRTRVAALRRVARGATISYDHTWRAPREATLAVLPVGYADGYSRLQSNRGEVLIRGRRAPVRGIVCMNLTVVEVTGIRGVAAGDEAVIFGTQGRARIRAEEVAARQATIPYEVLCVAGGLNRRVRGRNGRA